MRPTRGRDNVVKGPSVRREGGGMTFRSKTTRIGNGAGVGKAYQALALDTFVQHVLLGGMYLMESQTLGLECAGTLSPVEGLMLNGPRRYLLAAGE